MKITDTGMGSWALIGIVATLALALMTGAPSPALAATDPGCTALGGDDTTVPGECQISGVHNVSGVILLDTNETLHILTGGSIVTGAAGINIHITSGDFVMDSGALIDANVAGGCTPPKTGGAITVTLDNGDVDLATGSTIRSDSCSGGAIKITTTNTHTIDIDGLVESVGSISGVPNQPPGGGPITIVAGCALTVSDSGKVSSKGHDPGADLVHLEGCTVLIDGIVESTVFGNGGHVQPVNPPNHCNADLAAHPTFGPALNGKYTACVEIWGNTVTVDSTGTHNGEVNAGGVRTDVDGPKRGWIDIFARGDVTINANTAGAYAVHAEAAAQTNQFGGLINVKSQLGKVLTKALAPATKGLAIMANATGSGGTGGDIIVQAGGAAPNGEVDFTADSIQAIGSTTGGNANHGGGHISGQSFKDDVLGILPGELNASGGGAIGSPGVVTLRACGTANYTGTSTPVAVQSSGVDCLLNPTFPIVPQWSTLQSATAFLASSATCDTRCGVLCSKSGRKFNDLDGNGIDDPSFPGISGVQIHMFNQPGTPVFHDHQNTGAGGAYSFTGLAPGSYFVCEQGGPPTQTFPQADQTGGACATHVGVLGSRGYAVTLAPNPVTGACTDPGNDFGNHRTTQCPEDPNAVLTRSVSNPTSGVPNYDTLQAAYDAAANTGETIGMFGNTSENVNLGGGKTLKITQCTSARITAKNSGLPVWTISSTGKLTIQGPDSVGGTIGWWLQTPNHTLKSVRANGASQYGILVDSNGNNVSWNDVSGNGPGAGIRVNGGSNILKGGTVGPNNGDGVQVVGNTNTLSGATVQSNTANGVLAQGNTNTIKSNKANLNTFDGFKNAAGAGNKYSGNSSNTGGKENGGAEYRFVTTGLDGGSNRADGVNVPSAAKGCPTFNAGSVCE